MTCECYKVGGPFIAEDPDCPVHGVDGYEGKLEAMDVEIVSLRNKLQEARNKALEATIASFEVAIARLKSNEMYPAYGLNSQVVGIETAITFAKAMICEEPKP